MGDGLGGGGVQTPLKSELISQCILRSAFAPKDGANVCRCVFVSSYDIVFLFQARCCTFHVVLLDPVIVGQVRIFS